MELVLSIAYYVLIILFMLAFIASFIVNIVRSLKVNKGMKEKVEKVSGKVTEVVKEKKRVFVKVEYTAKSNHTKFYDYFEFTENEFKDQYYVDQEIEIYYPNIDDVKRVTCFPTYLTGQAIKPKFGPIVSDGLLAFVGIFVFYIFTNMIKSFGTVNFFSEDVLGTANATDCTTMYPTLMIMLPLFMYIMMVPYLIERFTIASKDQNHSYLKLYGVKCMAEVKTFKFGRAKDASGNKESLMQIEFYNNKGELIKTNLNSFLYTETQEQYINILYDVKNTKNVVYMRK